jgi:surface polysaccharide O-acyltransferase-like enzyme
VGLRGALVATFTLFPIALTGLGTKMSGAFLDNGSWQSAVYVLWDSIFSVGLFLALITLFRHFLDHQGRLAHLMSQHSFTVYIIHAPILVFLSIAIRSVNLEGLLKFALLAVIVIPACFTVAYLIRKIPLVANESKTQGLLVAH